MTATQRKGESVKTVVFLTLCLVTTMAHSQSVSPIIRVHAFYQEIISGVAPAMSEEGNVPQQSKRYAYHIFIECKPKARVTVRDLHINGKSYGAGAMPIASPVVRFHPTTLQSDTLIHATKNQILQITLGSDFEFVDASTLRESRTVVRYLYKAKRRSICISKFKELAPIAMP